MYIYVNLYIIHAYLCIIHAYVCEFMHNSHRYTSYRVDYEKDLSNYRLSLDYEEDYIVIKSIFEALYPKNPYFTLEDIICWLDNNPEIIKLNSHFRPSEGLLKSIKEDKISFI